MESETLLLCPKIGRDLQGFLTLRSEFPGRVMLLRYEDAADNPQQTGGSCLQVHRLLKFFLFQVNDNKFLLTACNITEVVSEVTLLAVIKRVPLLH